MITVQELSSHAKKLGAAYERALMPLSRQMDIPHTALVILLFFANNPERATASDVCERRGLKRAIVSLHVDRMVSQGLLERRPFPGDRRKDLLVPTQKAQPVIAAGREVQEKFAKTILTGLGEQDLAQLERCHRIMNANIETILKSGNV